MAAAGSVPTVESAPAGAWAPPDPTKLRGQAIALGVVALAGTAYTAAIDPNTSHAFPLCPLRYFTNLDCPLCGALRSVHSLTHADLAGAIDHNILFVLAAPVLVVAYVLWLGRTLGRDWPVPRLSGRTWIILGVLVTAFGVVRNLPIPGHDLLNSTSMLARNQP